MKTSARAMTLGLALPLIFLGVFWASFDVSAASKPKITSIKDIKANSAVLEVKSSSLKGNHVRLQVWIKNMETKKVTKQSFRFEDRKTTKSVTIDDLDSHTKYSVKVRVKKGSKEMFTDYSPVKKFTTL